VAEALGDAPDGDRGRGGADGEHGAGQPGEAGGLEHVLRQQRPDRDAGGESGATEHLGADQDRQCAALLRDLNRPGRGGGF
jgi:hypothetical protein